MVKVVWICSENALLPRTTYYWKVRAWFNQSIAVPYSPVSSFTTSLWDGWGQAEAIYSSKLMSFALLRSSLSVPIPDSCNVNTANLYVTAAETQKLTSGYKLYLNEVWLGSGPGRNNAQNIQQFDSFNVLEIIQNASLNNNVIPIALAAECYHQTQGAFQLSLDVQFLCHNSSVSNYTIFSSPNWKSFSADSIFNPSGSSGPTYTQPHENINGSNWIDNWKSFNFDDSKWEQATKVTPFSTLVAKSTLPIAVSIVPVVYLTEVSSGHYFFYLDKEVMGGIMLNAINPKNSPAQIEIRLGEELLGPNSVKYEMRTGNTYQDFWTLKPGQNTLEHHEYMEFRYGEILNFPGTLQVENINVWVYNYPFDDSLSSFTSSSPELNAIYELCKYTVKATSLDVFTDSNTRERQPYEADAYITALSLLSVAPSYSLVRESFEMVTAFSTWPTEWHLITIQAAYLDYMTTGDLTIANNFWSTLTNNSFVPQYFNSSLGLIDKPPNLANGIKDIVDWPLPLRDGYIFTNVNTVINSFVYCASVILSELAQLTNNTNDMKIFQNAASQIWKTANSKLVDDNGIFLDGLNVNHTAAHGSAFGLAFGLVDSSRYDSVIKFLAAKGMVGSPYYAHYLFEGLYKTFSSEASTLAYSLMISNDYNSWLYMLSQNATMTTEMWNITEKPNMSWSHPWSTTPLSTITRYLMGITPTSPSYSTVSIRPQPPLLSSSPFNASIVFPTIKGPISVSIVTSTDDSGKYSGADLSVVLPANVIASVYLPTGTNLLSKKIKKIQVLIDGKEIEAKNREGEFVKIDNIGAGLHVFRITI